MGAASSVDIKTALAKTLKFGSESDMPSYYYQIANDAATFAYYEVLERLLNRGFTKANVDAWDRLYDFTLRLGLWQALVLSGSYAEQPKGLIEGLDCRDHLSGTDTRPAVLLFVDGVWVQPTGQQPGVVTFGGQITQNSGVFRYDETDPDLGIPI